MASIVEINTNAASPHFCQLMLKVFIARIDSAAVKV